MSSRALRKLQGDNTIIPVQGDISDPESDLTSSDGARKKQLNVNRYDLFAQLSHSESEAKDDDDDSEPATGHGVTEVDRGDEAGESSRRKKKKKKKKVAKSSSNQKSSEDNVEVDEVERSVQEVNRILGEVTAAGASTSSDSRKQVSGKGVLSIEQRNLNPTNEQKRIFGSKIIQNEQNKRRGRGRVHVKSPWLVLPRENWPPISKLGLSMSISYSESGSGVQFFTFEHSQDYQQVERRFLQAVDSLDPDNIVAVLHAHPYHVDALLQLSDMCKMSEDLPMAAELNERVLYCLESAFHPSFNLASGNCRLDYRRQVNRALFIAIFKHLTFVGQRACYRTALEFCKLLLSLDPDEDPMAVVLCVDFYAIRAGEYAWLKRAAEEWEAKQNVSQLPNFAFSLAVAEFRLAEDGDVAVADQRLQKALIMFPSVLVPLLEKCGVQPDARVTAHPFFGVLNQVSQRPALTQLVQLYVARGYHVWRESDLLPWLETNVHRVLDRVDAGDPLVAQCHEQRLKRYLHPPRPVLRHIVLSDLKEVTAGLTEGGDDSILSYDPLPPRDTQNLYVPVVRSRRHEHSSMAYLFLRSLLPDFNANERVADGADANPAPRHEDGEEPEGAAGPVGAFQRSVATVVDRMRDLLNGIGINAPDAADDADDDDDQPRGQ